MTKLFFVPLLLLLVNCTALPHSSTPSIPSSSEASLLLIEPDRLPEIDVVLHHLHSLCALERDERMTFIRSDPHNTEFSYRFRRLLMASCEADVTPGVLAEELSYVATLTDWPQSYQNFFAMLKRQSQALRRADDAHKLRYEQLQLKLDALSEIEENIRLTP